MDIGSSSGECEQSDFVGARVDEGTLGLKGAWRARVSSAGVIKAVCL